MKFAHLPAHFRAAVGVTWDGEDPMFIVGAEGKPYAVNEAALTCLQWNEDWLLSHPFAEWTHTTDIKWDVEKYEQLRAGDIDYYNGNKTWVGSDHRLIRGRLEVFAAPQTDGYPWFCVSRMDDWSIVQAIGKGKAIINGDREKMDTVPPWLIWIAENMGTIVKVLGAVGAGIAALLTALKTL